MVQDGQFTFQVIHQVILRFSLDDNDHCDLLSIFVFIGFCLLGSLCEKLDCFHNPVFRLQLYLMSWSGG